MQLRCGYTGHDVHENLSNTTSFDMNVESDADRVISEYLVCPCASEYYIFQYEQFSAAKITNTFSGK